MGILVVFYSRSGHTRQIAMELATRCGADLDEICETQSRDGIWGYCRSALQVLTRSLPKIKRPIKNPTGYDTVIIGSPVWVGRPAAPVQAYLQQNAANLRQVAFFCTLGGSGDRQAFEEMGHLCGKLPLATLPVTEAQLPAALHATSLDDFVTRISSST